MKQSSLITDRNLDLLTIITAVVVIFVTLVIYAIYRRRKSSKRGILLTGLCNSGKTLVFAQLIHNKFVNTQTSIKENIADFSTDKGSLRVVDIPGHERLRDKFFDQYKSVTRGIVYVVDSATLQQNIRDAAEFLYNILSDPVVRNTTTSILILCNKQDLSLAKTPGVIKRMFEDELNKLRVTKSSQLESVDPKTKKSLLLLDTGKDFDFSLFKSVKVEFGTATSTKVACNINDLRDWLVQIA